MDFVTQSVKKVGNYAINKLKRKAMKEIKGFLYPKKKKRKIRKKNR